MLRLLLVIAIAAAVGYTAFVAARRRVRRTPRRRARIVGSHLAALALGLVLSLWLPLHVPETSGSPASMVAMLVLWIVGGGLAFLGLAGALGAWFTRPAIAPDGRDVT